MHDPSLPERLRRRVRFLLERLVLRGVRYRLLLAAAIIVAVALVGGGLGLTLDAGFEDVGEAVWWAFLRLTDPGYLGDDEGTTRRTISTLVTVLGYVLFLGLLIAILTQWMNEVIARLEAGLTPVALSGHVIILGFTHRTPTLVLELLSSRGRVQRFLARRGTRELHVVILAEQVDGGIVQQLRERLGDRWDDRRVLVRSGSPLRIDHLDRAAFRSAAVLILPGAGFGERSPESVDAQTVKTLMSVSRHARTSGGDAPLAVAELYDGRMAHVARRAYDGDSEIVAADEIVSRLIAQSIRQPGLWSIFAELLTLDVGNALYLRSFEGGSEHRFAELRERFPRAILLGFIRTEDGRPFLDPDPDLRVSPGDSLVCIARSYEDCALGDPAAESGPVVAARSQAPATHRTRRILVMGWSRKVPALLCEFARYGQSAFEVTVISAVPIAERERAMKRYALAAEDPALHQVEADFAVPGVLDALEPARFDTVVRLASERLSGEEEADATTVMAWLLLDQLLPRDDGRPQTFVELLEEENRFLFDPQREDVIVSPMVVGYLMSQVALRRELAAVFQELTRPWGPQIVLADAVDYLDGARPVRFAEVARAAQGRGEIALGLRRPKGPEAGLQLNPDHEAVWDLRPGDEVVLLTTYAEADEEPGPGTTA